MTIAIILEASLTFVNFNVRSCFVKETLPDLISVTGLPGKNLTVLQL